MKFKDLFKSKSKSKQEKLKEDYYKGNILKISTPGKEVRNGVIQQVRGESENTTG